MMRLIREEVKQYIRENYIKMSYSDIAIETGLKITQIKGYLFRNGLKLSKEERAKRNTNGQMKKGHTPWNKGMKGISVGGIETQFKIGSQPHNTKYDGCISLRAKRNNNEKYLFIRISVGKWMPYNRYVWEQHNPPLGKDEIIRYKDGNPLNCSIENLYKLSRAEHVCKNNPPDNDGRMLGYLTRKDKELREEMRKYPEIIELKRQQLKLNKGIKNARKNI